MCIAKRDMDCVYEAYFESNNFDPDDIPKVSAPIYIFGREYNAINGTDIVKIRQDITSKLWFTYRKNFVPIGGDDGFTSDKGWGCMLRCGQMVLGQALLFLQLGRDWIWEPDARDKTYLKILRKFEDTRQAPFSIHQIALTGVSEGKAVGQWFGPNTVAQVLKKLIKYDEGNSLTIHVALDNTLIVDDIRELCQIKEQSTNHSQRQWRPLLLIVPLRLGLTEINPIYVTGLKKCFKFKQSLGVIGGKPNLALYFVGSIGNEVIYLDPHTTQRAGSVNNKDIEEEIEQDLTYHCKYASRMNILNMDPSVAVCFLCKTEAEFVDLCQLIRENLMTERTPLFEISIEKPKEWIPNPDTMAGSGEAAVLGFERDAKFDSDNEFEIL
ncbi:hypothetical protein WA026_007967 [Henosepilachna vigintioctopunctata]|uniref:Cysteine protease n=1 Tax=Henosepilachna vigintioctopunctata TaxID=420089 RepID=A0AAW1TKI6_9CUCU